MRNRTWHRRSDL